LAILLENSIAHNHDCLLSHLFADFCPNVAYLKPYYLIHVSGDLLRRLLRREQGSTGSAGHLSTVVGVRWLDTATVLNAGHSNHGRLSAIHYERHTLAGTGLYLF
jgi:hypothetical protein